jgi:hypothetical protein
MSVRVFASDEERPPDAIASLDAPERVVVEEQERAWEREFPSRYPTEPAESETWRTHYDPHPVDRGGEVWESDLYDFDAWDTSADTLDRAIGESSDSSDDSEPEVFAIRPREFSPWGASYMSDDDGPEAAIEDGVDSDMESIWGLGLDNSSADAQPTVEAPVESNVETHEEVFWPNIETYISNPSGSKPIVTCVICKDSQLIIARLQERDARYSQEEPEVLPCGHIVGAECFEQWEEIARRPVKCPVCNAVVE